MKSNQSLLKSALSYSFVNILNAAIPFFMLPILTRLLLPEEYGIIAIFNATLGLLGAFVGLSVHGIVTVRYVDRKEIDYPRFIGSVIFILMISTLFILLITLLFRAKLSLLLSIPEEWLIIAVIISCLNVITQIRLGIWMMAGNVKKYGQFQTLMALTNMGFSLFFVVIMKWGYEGRFLGQTVAYILFGVIGFISIQKSGFITLRPKWEYVKESLQFGVPLLPHVMGGLLLGYADRFLINEYLGLESAGIYMVAAQFGLGMGLITDAFNKAFVPWLFEHLKVGSMERKVNIVNLTRNYALVIFLLAGILASVSYWILLIIAGEKYTEASVALQWVFCGLAFNGLYLMVTNYIFYSKKTYLLAWITLFSGIVGLCLTWYLIQKIGIAGASLAYTITMVIRFILTWIVAQKLYPMPWKKALS